MPSINIQVCLLHRDNSLSFSCAVPKAKMLFFSQFAEREYNSGRMGHDRLIFQALPEETQALKHVLQWIQGNDMDHPTSLTVQGLSIDTFEACVHVHRATNRLSIRRDLRGDDVRETILGYMKQGCLRFDEFAMVVELLDFDQGAVNSAKYQVMLGRSRGGAARPPEMHLIEAYVRVNGLGFEMAQLERRIAWRRMQVQQHQARNEQATAHLARAAAVASSSTQGH